MALDSHTITLYRSTSFDILDKPVAKYPVPGAPLPFFATNDTHTGISWKGAAWVSFVPQHTDVESFLSFRLHFFIIIRQIITKVIWFPCSFVGINSWSPDISKLGLVYSLGGS